MSATLRIPNADELLEKLKLLHRHIRAEVVAACERQSVEAMSSVVAEDEGDTTFAIDKVSEEALVEFFAREVAPRWPMVLVAEGLQGGQVVLPYGSRAEDAIIRVIVDPIDGTRMIMYQKRSAWILTGVAPNKGEGTSLRDIEIAVQTEIPTLKQHLCDMMWTTRGGPVVCERTNRLNGESLPLPMHASGARDLLHGFAAFAKLFHNSRSADIGALEDAVFRKVVGEPRYNKAQAFDDQYISNAGQLYGLMCGQDRFIADLRPLFYTAIPLADNPRGLTPGICSHPYDMSTWLIAEQAGAILTNVDGSPFDAPFNVESDVGWIGYANQHLRDLIEPVLMDALKAQGFSR